jgi:hypothetical protein
MYYYEIAKSELLIAGLLKIQVFWDVAPCQLVNILRFSERQ